jgi:molecular chaperone DnaK (HSP70)
MSEVAVDFGTSNTVIARHNETTGEAETLEIPGITSRMIYRLTPDAPEVSVWITPSMIHYSEEETLIGDQVVSRGLAEHPDTLRWMKRAIAQGHTRRRKTAQGHISPEQAGEDFLRLLLNYASDRLSFEKDSFTFTAPVEAFEHFQDWLWRVCETLGIRRARLLDEPTSCIFGYHGAARRDEKFVIFDFGGGTLDTSVVRIEPAATEEKKAIQLGQAGRDLGGMDIDRWLFDDFCARHSLLDYERRELEALILRQAEAAKIKLSDPLETEAEINVLTERSGMPRVLRATYSRACRKCDPGGNSLCDGCFGCLLQKNNLVREARDVLQRALENAAIKSGVRRDDITGVMVTGGASLIPAVRQMLEQEFDAKIDYDHPFDCVARGACRGVVDPILTHDYAIESYNRERKEYEFKPLFKISEEYPTPPEKPKKLWCRGAYEGATRIGLKIFEVSRMKRVSMDGSIVDASGALREDSRVASEFQYTCLNAGNETFIIADPPFNLKRDQERFLSAFSIDGNRRLLVTVIDNLTGKAVLKDHPVVRL